MHESWGHLPSYDPSDPVFAADPVGHLAALRAASWAARDPFGLSVLRHAEVGELARDERLAEWGLDLWRLQGIDRGELIDWGGRILPSRGGPDHRSLRALINPALGARAVEGLRLSFRSEAERLLDRLPEGPTELMESFANPFALRVVTAVLGIGPDDPGRIEELAATVGSAFSLTIGSRLPAIEAALRDLDELARELLAAPPAGSDLLRALAASPLPGQDARALVIEILESGYDTLRNQIGCALVLLLDEPRQWELAREDASLVGGLVEECLRLFPAIPAALRVATEAVEVHDVVIPPGTFVALITASANRDERVFDRPDVFDVHRATRAPLAFGGGPHRCVGVAVARIGMEETFAALTRRHPGVRRRDAVEWNSLLGVRGPTRLMVKFSRNGP